MSQHLFDGVTLIVGLGGHVDLGEEIGGVAGAIEVALEENLIGYGSGLEARCGACGFGAA